MAQAGPRSASNLPKEFGYGCVDSDILKNNEARRENVCCFDLEDERSPSFLTKIEELMSNRSFHKIVLMATVYRAALGGNVVFLGMGAQVILSGLPDTVHLQAVRFLSERAKAIAEVQKIPYPQALSLVNKMDAGKKAFLSHYFDANINEPTLYHLTINASCVSLEHALDLTSRYCQLHFSSEGSLRLQTALRCRLLEKRAEILLFRLGMVHAMGKIEFQATGEGVLSVKGIIGGEHEKEKLLEALERLEEVNKVEDHMRVGVLSRIVY
jgi:hypothetical protein